MNGVEEYEVYAAIGEQGFRQLVAAFYRQIPGDAILGPLYHQDDLAGAEERLGDFLVYRFGGPQRYLETRGHPRLRMRHARFPIGEAARDRWVQLMAQAFREARLDPEAESVLRGFFESTATFLINHSDRAAPG